MRCGCYDASLAFGAETKVYLPSHDKEARTEVSLTYKYIFYCFLNLYFDINIHLEWNKETYREPPMLTTAPEFKSVVDKSMISEMIPRPKGNTNCYFW